MFKNFLKGALPLTPHIGGLRASPNPQLKNFACCSCSQALHARCEVQKHFTPFYFKLLGFYLGCASAILCRLGVRRYVLICSFCEVQWSHFVVISVKIIERTKIPHTMVLENSSFSHSLRFFLKRIFFYKLYISTTMESIAAFKLTHSGPGKICWKHETKHNTWIRLCKYEKFFCFFSFLSFLEVK